MKQFENMTIGELKKRTAEWNKIDWDKIKYPNKARKLSDPSAQDLIDSLR